MLVVFSVGVAALIWDYNGAYRKNVEEITRKTYGKGKRTEELRVEGKDRVLGEIPIEVTEQVYGEQEISQVLKQAVKKMDSLILGECKSGSCGPGFESSDRDSRKADRRYMEA